MDDDGWVRLDAWQQRGGVIRSDVGYQSTEYLLRTLHAAHGRHGRVPGSASERRPAGLRYGAGIRTPSSATQRGKVISTRLAGGHQLSNPKSTPYKTDPCTVHMSMFKPDAFHDSRRRFPNEDAHFYCFVSVSAALLSSSCGLSGFGSATGFCSGPGCSSKDSRDTFFASLCLVSEPSSFS